MDCGDIGGLILSGTARSKLAAGRIAHTLARLTRLTASFAHGSDLPPPQWEALRYLALANRFSRSPTAVADWLRAGRSSTSQTLSALKRKGFIRYEVDPKDKRWRILELTPEGAAMLMADPLRSVAQAAESLDGALRDRLSADLSALLVSAEAEFALEGHAPCKACRHFAKDDMRCNLLDEALSSQETQLLCSRQEAKDS